VPSHLRVGLPALVALSQLGCISPTAREPAQRLVATVRQFGPVGYRDPLGAVSPDGKWLATSAHNLLRVQGMGEATTRTLPSGDARILHLVYRPDGRLVTQQPDSVASWWLYDVAQGVRRSLWPPGTVLRDSAGHSVGPGDLRELAWSADGAQVVGVQLSSAQSVLWIMDSAGKAVHSQSFSARLSYPVWLRDGRIACLALSFGAQRVTLPCGEDSPPGLESREAYGPLAASPDGRVLYLALPDAHGFVTLWAWNLAAGTGRSLAAMGRDTYAPSVSNDGTVLFKSQEYWTEVAVMPASGGPAELRTAFQAETPSWDPAGRNLGITYGTWRRVSDDFRYPDIAQDAGSIPAEGNVPATAPAEVVQASASEDQGLSWSPNQRWIVFHSHQQGSDDVWLRPADRAEPLTRLTRLGRGAEVGWPRWSPDGRWIVFEGDSVPGRRRSQLWVIGVDQKSGRVTVPARAVALAGFRDAVGHAEWLGSSDVIVFSGVRGAEHALYRVARTGGTPTLIHSYTTTQIFDGFGASPDGRWLVFPQPDQGGRLQLFRVAVGAGAAAEQLTTDSTEKTQPAVSPDGGRIAFTRWRYAARFWTLKP